VSRSESADKSELQSLTIPVIEERAVLLTKPRDKATVRVHKVVREREAQVEALIRADDVHVERTVLERPIPVDASPPVRQEGDTTVIPILEERLVVEKRLFVCEELRVRRVQHTRLARERVTLRREDVVVDREQSTKPSVHGDKPSPDKPQEREMKRVLIGVFDSRSQAETACQELRESGVPEDQIAVRGRTPEEANAAVPSASGEDDHPGFFARLFGWTDDQTSPSPVYTEAIRRGSCVVVVDGISDDQVDETVRVLEQNGAVDIDERADNWRAEGWASAPSSSQRAPTQMQAKSEPHTQMGGGSTRIPVVEEQLQVGKREVQRGGVRIFSRTTERPVQQEVTLREEQVRVERRPVDRPATEAELGQAFQEKSVELRETAEEPVIAKTARVVEEVEISKQVAERTQTVHDTVRRTDVNVESSNDRSGSVTQFAREGSTPTSRSGSFADQRSFMDTDGINRVLRDELSAIETYRQALERNRDEYGQDARFQQLVEMLHDHEQAAGQLRQLIDQQGGTGPTDSGAWGTWANTVMGTAKLFGDGAALKALKEGEESGIKDYRALLDDQNVPAHVNRVLTAIVDQAQRHVTVLDDLIDAA
jgi:uncharacterized protein (TIGR02271 family)